MEAGGGKRDAADQKRDAADGNWDARWRRRRWTFGADRWRLAVWRSIRGIGRARRVRLVLGATAMMALAAALFVGFRDSADANRVDAAAIGATQFSAGDNQSAGAPSNDDFHSQAYFPTPFSFPGYSSSLSLPESTAGATLEAGESAPCG